MNTETSSKKVVLRKKSPFNCRTQDAHGTYTCLAILAETDGNLCPACKAHAEYVALPAEVKTEVVAAIPEPSDWREGRTHKIWPTQEDGSNFGPDAYAGI